MKIVRFLDTQDLIGHGVRRDDGSIVLLEGDLFGTFRESDTPAQVKRLLAPLTPVSLPCIGLNYRQHAEETGARIPDYPVLFHKAISSVQHPNEPIQIPMALKSAKVDYEVELAVVIGRACKNVKKEDALKYVLGYTCANDVSARDWQKEWGGSQWSRGKTFDTFCPLGPWIVTADEIPDPNNLQIRCLVNGEVRQDCHTSGMIFDVPTLIEFLSGSTTLLPGTVILTGTPSGVAMGMNPPPWLKEGDEVTVEIESIGSLTNPVENEPL